MSGVSVIDEPITFAFFVERKDECSRQRQRLCCVRSFRLSSTFVQQANFSRKLSLTSHELIHHSFVSFTQSLLRRSHVSRFILLESFFLFVIIFHREKEDLAQRLMSDVTFGSRATTKDTLQTHPVSLRSIPGVFMPTFMVASSPFRASTSVTTFGQTDPHPLRLCLLQHASLLSLAWCHWHW